MYPNGATATLSTLSASRACTLYRISMASFLKTGIPYEYQSLNLAGPHSDVQTSVYEISPLLGGARRNILTRLCMLCFRPRLLTQQELSLRYSNFGTSSSMLWDMCVSVSKIHPRYACASRRSTSRLQGRTEPS